MVPDVDLDAAEDLGVEHLDVAVQDAVGPGVVVPDAVARDVVDLDAVGLDAVVLDVVVGHVVELMDALVQDVASVKKKNKFHIKSMPTSNLLHKKRNYLCWWLLRHV